MDNIDNSIKKNRKKSILLIIFILVLIASIMGGTYAYLAFSASNNSVVVGEIGVPDLELNVSKVTPVSNNGDLVPQLEKSLDTAVSSSHNCVDGNGNPVCQVYKIDIKNTGTAKVVVDGTIDFTNTTVPNLKYKLMTDSTTLDTTFNSRYGYGDMEDRPMVKGVSLEPEQVETYYIVFWINDTENEQTDTGTYRASINFNSSYLEGLTSTYVNYLTRILGTTDYFHASTYKTYIKKIAFVNYIDTSSAVESWDVGTLKNGGVIAWVEDNETSGFYDLYIGSQDTIRPLRMDGFFYGMTNVTEIDFNNLDTSEVTNMSSMFDGTGQNSSSFVLDLGDNFDTSNVTDMSSMFNRTGQNSSSFVLDLGDKFDTSNVTNMSSMFKNAGVSSVEFTLDLGRKFDTSNVTNMDSMFWRIGEKSLLFTLDLSEKFDTSNVTDMGKMFYNTGYYSTEFILNLGEKFDTSNVTDMESMFEDTGSKSLVFTLDLGEKFDTSKVINMKSMFGGTGKSSPVFTLDLGDKFNTSSITDMYCMFSSIGYENANFELDLTKFTFDNVTSYGSMFNFRSTQKIYVKNESDKAWLVSKGFSGVTNSNVIVKS